MPPLSVSLPPQWAIAYPHFPSRPPRPLGRSLDPLCQPLFSSHQCLFLSHMPGQASWGTGLYSYTHRGRHGQRRPWRGAALGPPGPVQPEEALVEVGFMARTCMARRGLVGGCTQVFQDLCSWRRSWLGRGSGLRPTWLWGDPTVWGSGPATQQAPWGLSK